MTNKNCSICINSFLLALSMILLSCNSQNEYKSGNLIYFESFANYEIPFRPIGELTEEDAKSRKSYYTATFNDGGKILSFSKYLGGEIEFDDKYVYDQKGALIRRELTKSNGEVIVHEFDKAGKIKEKK
jgi:hypothetical protein